MKKKYAGIKILNLTWIMYALLSLVCASCLGSRKNPPLEDWTFGQCSYWVFDGVPIRKLQIIIVILKGNGSLPYKLTSTKRVTSGGCDLAIHSEPYQVKDINFSWVVPWCYHGGTSKFKGGFLFA